MLIIQILAAWFEAKQNAAKYVCVLNQISDNNAQYARDTY